MPPSNSRPKEVQKLLAESVARRPLPQNFQESDLQLFNHELERLIPESRLLEFMDVQASSAGVLFRSFSLLPESFAFPANRELWKRRSLIRFFVDNYLRRTRAVDRDALWITDDWSYGYFHWLTDVLTRLYVVRKRVNQFVLLLPAAYETLEFVQASLKCFGVTEVDYVRQNEVIRCRRLFMPSHTAPSGHYNEGAIRGVRALLLNCFGAVESRGNSERIYVSRGRAPKRRLLNEEPTREVLEEFGFETIYAEDYSFAQQVEIFSRARYIVSNHGAGLTNMLFAREGGSVLELRHHTDAINNCYFTLAAALGLNYFYQTCRSDAQQDPHTADLVVDLTTLRANLQLLTKP